MSRSRPTPSPPRAVSLAENVPLDRVRALLVGASDHAAGVFRHALPWLDVTTAPAPAAGWALPHADGAFDCVVVEAGAAHHGTDTADGIPLLDAARRVLEEGGALVSEDGIEWKRCQPLPPLGRATEAMHRLYLRLEPDDDAPESVRAEGYLEAGRADRRGYCLVLGELLRREGCDVAWVTMLARSHPLGRGLRGAESHEVLRLRTAEGEVVLDPTTDRVLPHPLEALLARPALAVPNPEPDARYRDRAYALYDTAEWYGRVARYAVRTAPDQPLRPWSWKPVTRPDGKGIRQ